MNERGDFRPETKSELKSKLGDGWMEQGPWASVGMLCCGPVGLDPDDPPLACKTHANRPLKNYPASSGATALKLFGTPIQQVCPARLR